MAAKKTNTKQYLLSNLRKYYKCKNEENRTGRRDELREIDIK